MRHAALLLAMCVLLAGCGGDEAAQRVTTSTPGGPPPFQLRSEAGTQTAIQGSSCVASPQDGGIFGDVCVDTIRPRAVLLSVIRPGETVTISMPGARLAAAEARVHPLDCSERVLRKLQLQPGETLWPVTLPAGAYEVSLFGRFRADNGSSGDSSAVAGLLVSATDELELLDAGDRAAPCH
ncbi:MAG: hypothetical protein ABR521_11035 [Gaiellaceae bacterium]